MTGTKETMPAGAMAATQVLLAHHLKQLNLPTLLREQAAVLVLKARRPLVRLKPTRSTRCALICWSWASTLPSA